MASRAAAARLAISSSIRTKTEGEAAGKAYTADRYHKPADEFDPGWNFDGVMQDLQALYGVGRTLADGEQWPNWYEGNPFRAAREEMMSGEGAR